MNKTTCTQIYLCSNHDKPCFYGLAAAIWCFPAAKLGSVQTCLCEPILLTSYCSAAAPCFWASKMPRGHKGPKHAGTSDTTVTQWMYFGMNDKKVKVIMQLHRETAKRCYGQVLLWVPTQSTETSEPGDPGPVIQKIHYWTYAKKGFKSTLYFQLWNIYLHAYTSCFPTSKKPCWTQRHLLPLRKKVCCQNHKKSGCVTLMMAQHTFKVIWRRLRRRVVTDFFVANCGCLSSFLADGDEDGPWCWWFHSRKGLVYCMLIRMDFVFDLWFVFNFKTMQIAKNETHWTFPNRLCWIQRLRQLCKWHTPQTTNSILICFVGFSHHWASCFRVHLLGCHCYHDVFKDGTYPRERCKVFHVLSSSRLDLHDVSNALGFVSTGCRVNQNMRKK